jgi:enamine deaminase RidA (YjgF/YER057c/UK114 family)
MDLAMLALSEGGRERSVAEFDTLLRAAGLKRTSVVTTDSPLAVIEAVAA